MVEETNKDQDIGVDALTDGTDEAGPNLGALLMPLMMNGRGGASLKTAEGVGALLGATAAFIDGELKPDVVDVTDPDTGITVLATIGRDGVRPLPDTFFDGSRYNPRFRRGVATLTSLDSFIAHVSRFGDADSVVFACDDRDAPKLTAVLDYHRADFDGVHGEYRHGKHRTAFAFPLSDEWKAWKATNGKSMSMEEFARFLEDRVLDVADVNATVPESAKRFVEMNGGVRNIADWALLTKLAKGLTIYENAIVTNATNLASGTLQLTITESQNTEVEGIKIDVPTMFFIDIPLFREGVIYRVPVRLRHRKGRGSITFSYELWGHERAFKDAFGEAVARVDEETPAIVLYGSPEA